MLLCLCLARSQPTSDETITVTHKQGGVWPLAMQCAPCHYHSCTQHLVIRRSATASDWMQDSPLCTCATMARLSEGHSTVCTTNR